MLVKQAVEQKGKGCGQLRFAIDRVLTPHDKDWSMLCVLEMPLRPGVNTLGYLQV